MSELGGAGIYGFGFVYSDMQNELVIFAGIEAEFEARRQAECHLAVLGVHMLQTNKRKCGTTEARRQWDILSNPDPSLSKAQILREKSVR